MAVNISVEQLAGAIRAGEAPEILEQVTRLRGIASTMVLKHAPDAPDEAHDMAVVRMVGYWFDMPTVARGTGLANIIVNSGAGVILLPWRVIRAGTTAEAVAAANDVMGSVGNPVTDVDIDAGQLVVTFADGTVDRQDLPTGPGGAGLDQTARDAAAAAQTTADAATTEAEATDLIAPFARATADTTDVMPPPRLAENPADDNVPLVVGGGRSFRFVHRDTLGTQDQVARDAAAAAQTTADAATTPSEARDQARIAMEPWARLNSIALIPGDQVDLSGITVSAEDAVARAQATANAAEIVEIEAGEHTITPAGILPTTDAAHHRTIYGRGPAHLAAITLHYLKRSLAHRFSIRLDNLTINTTHPLFTAQGWATVAYANRYRAGGRIWPQQPSGLFALVRIYDRTANQFQWRLHKPGAAPLYDAQGNLVTDDDVWLTFYDPDTGAQHGDPVNMVRMPNQSYYNSVPATNDPALLNLHQIVEVEFGSTNDVQRERYNLGYEDNHISQLLDEESKLALEGFSHSEVEALREAIKPFARKDAAVDQTPTMQDLGGFGATSLDDIANDDSGVFVYTGEVRRATDGTLAYIGGRWTEVAEVQAVGAAEDWARVGNDDAIPLGKLTNVPEKTWHWIGFVNGGFTAGVDKALSLRPFPFGAYADMAALHLGIVGYEIPQICVVLGQNDVGDADNDTGLFVLPNSSGLNLSNGVFRAFPAWQLNVNPISFRIAFHTAGVNVQTSSDVPASPNVQVRIGVWA